MIKSHLLISVFAFFYISSSHACDPQLQNWKFDCDMQDRFQKVRLALQNDFGVNAENLLEYQVLRFVDSDTWEKEKARGNYDPATVYKPAPATWNKWQEGARYIDSHPLYPLSLETLKNTHKMTLTKDLMSFWAIHFKGAAPGEIRHSMWQMPPEFFYDCTGNMATPEVVETFKNHDIQTTSGESMLTSYFKWCENSKNYSGQVFYLSSQDVPAEMSLYIKELNAGPVDSSPIAFIANYQRKFIAIHPFGDGNGRMSRFIQDSYLKSFDLPYPASGDLQEDIATPLSKYELSFKAAMVKSVVYFERCYEQYKSGQIGRECREINEP